MIVLAPLEVLLCLAFAYFLYRLGKWIIRGPQPDAKKLKIFRLLGQMQENDRLIKETTAENLRLQTELNILNSSEG